MKANTLLIGVLLSIQSVFAEVEYTVELEEFRQEVTIEVSAIPLDVHEFRIEPKRWEKFEVQWVASHGKKVKKGDKVVLFDQEPYIDSLKEAEGKMAIGMVKLEKLEAELWALEEKYSSDIAEMELSEKRSQEDMDYFFQVERKEKSIDAKLKLQQSERYLSYQKEEYDQLLKMYAEDDLTEETEEIILIRAKNRLQDYERAVEKSQIELDHILEVKLERDSKDWRDKHQDLTLKLEGKKKMLKLTVQLKKEELAEAKRKAAFEQDEIEKLRSDESLLAYYAPVDGVIHYGSFMNNEWKEGPSEKSLREGQTVPLYETLLTVVPAETNYQLAGRVSEDVAESLRATSSGVCWWKSHAWEAESVQLEALDRYPQLKGDFVALYSFPQTEVDVFPGKLAKVQVLCYQAASAMKVSLDYLSKTGEGKVFVRLKMAEGEPEKREVLIGRVNETEAEVISGIHPGQVLMK